MIIFKRSLTLLCIGILAITLSACKKAPYQSTALTPTPSPLVSSSPQIVDHHASFLIFTNGTKRDFSASRYHNLSKDVYIEAQSPTTVYVTKARTTWNDLFLALPMKLTKDCLTTGTGQVFCTGQNGTLKFYVNGVKTDNLLDSEIKDGDKVLITFGNESETQIQNQLSQVPNP